MPPADVTPRGRKSIRTMLINDTLANVLPASEPTTGHAALIATTPIPTTVARIMPASELVAAQVEQTPATPSKSRTITVPTSEPSQVEQVAVTLRRSPRGLSTGASASSTPKASPAVSPRVSPRAKAPVDYNETRASKAAAKGKKPMPRVNVIRSREGAEVIATMADFDARTAYRSGSRAASASQRAGERRADELDRLAAAFREASPVQTGDSTPSYDSLSDAGSKSPRFQEELRLAFAANKTAPAASSNWPSVRESMFSMGITMSPEPQPGVADTTGSVGQGEFAPQSRHFTPDASGPPYALVTADGPLSGASPSFELPPSEKSLAAKQRKVERVLLSKHLPVMDAKLRSVIPASIRSHFRNGEYTPSEAEVNHRDTFFKKAPTLVTLRQKDAVTSLHLFNPKDDAFVKPSTVLVDTGAEIRVMISPRIAKTLGLTWTPASAKLIGIGGVGGADGYSKERINVRMGGFTGKAHTSSPFTGCFMMSLQPLVMQQRTVNDIGVEVILGQGFLRSCLGSVNSVTETLDYSPAWISHACRELRCSVPCNMSETVKTGKVMWARCHRFSDNTFEHEPLHRLVSALHKPNIRPADVVPKPHHVSFEAGTISPVPTQKEVKGQASSNWPHTSSPNNTQHLRAAPVTPHPGFPQTGVATKEAYADHRAKQAARRRHDNQVSQQAALEGRARQSERLAHVVAPASIAYAVRDLQASGRLMDGFKLDLSPGNVLSESQIQTVVNRAMERMEAANKTPLIAPPAPVSTPAEIIDLNDQQPVAEPTSSVQAPVADVALRRSTRDIKRMTAAQAAVTLPVARAAIIAALASLIPITSAQHLEGHSHFSTATFSLQDVTVPVTVAFVLLICYVLCSCLIRQVTGHLRTHVMIAFACLTSLTPTLLLSSPDSATGVLLVLSGCAAAVLWNAVALSTNLSNRITRS